MCIEITLGMKIMGVFAVIGAILSSFTPLALLFAEATVTQLINAIILLALCGLSMYGGFLWFKWLRNDDADTRKGAILANALNVVGQLLSSVWILIYMVIFLEGFSISGLMTNISSNIISMLLSFYYYTVTRRYAAKHGDEVNQAA